jgi:hypothetical protein
MTFSYIRIILPCRLVAVRLFIEKLLWTKKEKAKLPQVCNSDRLPHPLLLLHYRDTNVRARLTGATVPIANLSTLGSAAEQRFRPAQLISSISIRAQPTDPSLAPIILVGDADPFMPELMHALCHLPRAVYLVSLPPVRQLAGLRSCRALAGVMLAAVQSKVPRGPCVVAGIGAGGVVAHELALQLNQQGHEVRGDDVMNANHWYLGSTLAGEGARHF